MTADELTFNEELGIATARGNVEITQGDYILRADTVYYNQRDDVVSASSNVVLLDPRGEVYFAEFAELTGDLREGFLRGFRMLMQDDSRLAAISAQRRGGVETRLDRAAYSPCVDCLGPGGEPLWQVNARRVTHDSVRQEVVYNDATIRMFGIPVFYTPYLSHPDPTVERKSGFLSPTFGASTIFGTSVQVPYFWAIDDQRDITFDPILFVDKMPVVTGEYRQRFASGETRTRLSTARDDAQTGNYRFRGHIDSGSQFSIDDTWRSGADIKLASDDTYMQRYNFGHETTLTNRLYVEGFGARSYAVGEGYFFQSLTQGVDQATVPVVLPKFDYNYVSEPGRFGGITALDANLQALSRREGTSSQRLSLTPRWEASHTDSLGSITALRLSLQADAYNVEHGARSSGTADGVTGRLFPQAMLSWRYPWVRRMATASQTFEPIAALVVGPNGGNPAKIPNEDSRSVELDDTNLFSASRFSGRDRVEGGQRVVYGMRTGWFGDSGGSTSLFVGQSFRLREEQEFTAGSGLDQKLSDYVASLQVSPHAYVDLLYKSRIDKDNFRTRRSEVSSRVGPPALRLDLNYVFFDRTAEFAKREEIFAALSSRLTQRWRASVNTRRDLTKDGGALSYGGEITFLCDCMDFSVRYSRTFTRDRDVPPNESLIFRVTLKSLGQLESSAF